MIMAGIVVLQASFSHDRTGNDSHVLGYLLPATVAVILSLAAYMLPELIAYLYIPEFGNLSVARILALDSNWMPSAILVLLGMLAAFGCLKRWNRNDVS